MCNIYLLRQIWVSTGVFFNIIGVGMVLAYSSCLLKGLKEPDSPFSVDVTTASSLVSSITICWSPGLFISSYLMEKIGRKISHAILILPGIIGWIVIYLATSVSMLIYGRILGGLYLGATVSLGAVSIGEFTDPKVRGILLNTKNTSACIGVTALHILGQYFHWKTIALLSIFPTVLGLAITLTWPESPAWLASKNRFKESQISYTYLRGDDNIAVDEFQSMVSAQKSRKQALNTNTNFVDKLKMNAKHFTEKSFLKPLGIMIVSLILEEACGRHLFAAYGPEIVMRINAYNQTHYKADSTDKSFEFLYVLTIDLITVGSASAATIFFVIFKRRTLLFYSGMFSVMSLLLVCAYLYVVSLGFIVKVTWIPFCLFVMYYILINFGCSPIPLILLGEIFPLPCKGLGTAICSIVLPLSLMVVLRMMPILLASIHLHGTFFVFAIAIALCLLYLYFTLPETKNRTLQEIEDYFNIGMFVTDGKDIETAKTLLK